MYRTRSRAAGAFAAFGPSAISCGYAATLVQAAGLLVAWVRDNARSITVPHCARRNEAKKARKMCAKTLFSRGICSLLDDFLKSDQKAFCAAYDGAICCTTYLVSISVICCANES
jgi:hypothetical protein